MEYLRERQLSRVASLITDAVIIINRNGSVAFADSAAEAVLGIPREEMIGQACSDFTCRFTALDGTPPLERHPFIQALLNAEHGHKVECVLERPNGASTVLCISAAPMFDDRGAVANFVLSLRDITKQKRIEEEFAELMSVLDSTEDAIITMALDGTILSWNSGAQKTYGYAGDEIIGRPIQILAPPDRQYETLYNLERIRRGERVAHFETVRIRKSGKPIEVSLSLSPIKDANGDIKGASIIARNITARRAMEKALEAERERLAVTLASIGDGVIATDIDGNVMLLNKIAEDLTGWSQEEAEGRPMVEVFNIINEVTREPAENPVEKVLKEGIIIGLANHTAIISKEGVERSIADSCAPIRDRSGSVIGAVLVFRDVTEEKQAEEALRESERRFRGMLENANLITVILNAQGNIVFANDFMLNLTGWQREEVVNKNWFDVFVAPESQGDVRQCFHEKVLKGVVSVHSDYDIMTRAGERRSVSFNRVLLRNAEGEIIGSASIGEDITDRKRAEKALEAERERLAVTLASIGDGVIATDIDGNVMLLNKIAEDLTGWSQEEAEGRPMVEVFNIVHEATGDPAENPINEVLETGRIYALANHISLIAKDGTQRSIADSCAPIRDKGGDVLGAVLVFRDVTEHKRAEAERTSLANRVRLLMDSTDEGIYGVDHKGACILVNKAATEMLGYDTEEVLGKNAHQLFHHSHEDGTQYPIEDCPAFQAAQTGQGRRVDSEVFWRKDGTSFPVEYSSYPIVEEGKITGSVVTFVDITERKAQKALNHALNHINSAISSTLDFDEILQTVAAEAAKAIGAETATVDLCDGTSWVTRYVHGFPQAIAGVRFSERDIKAPLPAIQTGEPVIVSDALNDGQVSKKVMDKYNIRSLLSVPLLIRDSVVGLIAFMHHSNPSAFSDLQLDFANKLMASVSLAIENARRYEAERRIADTLQEALLTIPSEIPRLGVGHLYRSATEAAKVGGDFYDLFELNDDTVGILVGDVSGKGLEAATLTSLVKNTIRAYAHLLDSPAEIMARANEVIIRYSEDSSFVTAFLGILNTHSGELTYCNAGHPPAILKKRSAGASHLAVGSPVIGAFNDLSYVEHNETLQKGDVLMLYTDGVIEARHEGIFFGEDRLLHLMHGLTDHAAEDVPRLVFDEIMDCTHGKLSDDVALLSVALT